MQLCKSPVRPVSTASCLRGLAWPWPANADGVGWECTATGWAPPTRPRRPACWLPGLLACTLHGYRGMWLLRNAWVEEHIRRGGPLTPMGALPVQRGRPGGCPGGRLGPSWGPFCRMSWGQPAGRMSQGSSTHGSPVCSPQAAQGFRGQGFPAIAGHDPQWRSRGWGAAMRMCAHPYATMKC